MNQNPNFDFYSFVPPTQGEPTEPAPAAPTEPSLPPVLETPEACAVDSTCGGVREETKKDAEREKQLRRQTRLAYSRAGWAYFVMMLAWYVFSELFSVLFYLLAPASMLDSAIFGWLDGTLPLYLCGVPLLVLCLKGLPRALPERRPLGLARFLLLACMALGLMTAGSLLGNTFMSVINTVTGYDFSNWLGTLSDIPLWLTALLSCVLAPFFEELIFRKLLLDRLLPYGQCAAVVITAVLFGLFHSNFYQFFYATLLGILFGFVYVRTGKLRHCILLHATVNFIGGVLSMIIMDLVDYDALLLLETTEQMMEHMLSNLPGMLALFGYELLMYGFGFAGLILLLVFRKKLHLTKQPLELSERRTAPKLLNSGMLAALVLSVGLFALYFASFFLV